MFIIKTRSTDVRYSVLSTILALLVGLFAGILYGHEFGIATGTGMTTVYLPVA